MNRPRRVRRLARWIVTNARALGATIFIFSIVFTRLSKPFHDGLERFHEDFANNVDTAFGSLRNLSAETAHLVYDRHDLIPIYMTEVFLDPSLSSIAKDALIALLDSSSAAWHMCTALIRLYLHFIRGIMRLSHTCFPHLSPIVSLCAEEFAALPLRGQLLILSSIGVNALALVAWRRGWLAKVAAKLLAWHQSVALTVIALGPYLLVFVLLYLPTKNALSFSTFRVAFQWVAFTVMLLQSLAACAQIWNAKDRSEPLNYACTPCPQPPHSARLTEAPPPRSLRSPNTVSLTPRAVTEQRQHITSLLSNALNYWALVICWHLATQVAYMILELLLDTQIPVYNFWNLGSATDVPTHRVVLTRQSILDNSLVLLDRTDLASTRNYFSPPTPSFATRVLVRVSWSLITLDEMVTLLMILASVIGDEKTGRVLRRACTSSIEWLIRRVTGLDIRLVANRSLATDNSRSPGAMDTAKERIGFLKSLFLAWTQAEYSRRFARVFTYADRLADLFRHFAPLTLLLLPIFILRWVFLTIALVIPGLYSLRALWTQQLALQAYWLCYFTGLVICLAIGDTLATSSSVAGYLLSGIRAKLAVVSLLQFICVEPKTLGTWVARQATRVSVSAIATARRRVIQTPSTLPSKSPASTAALDSEDVPRASRRAEQPVVYTAPAPPTAPPSESVPDELNDCSVPRPTPSAEAVSRSNVERLGKYEEQRRPSETISHDTQHSFARSLSTSVKSEAVRQRRKGSEATTTSELSFVRERRASAVEHGDAAGRSTQTSKKRQPRKQEELPFKRASSQVVDRRRPSSASLTGTKSK